MSGGPAQTDAVQRPLRHRIGSRLAGLLYSSRPNVAMMPGYVADNFVDNLLFALSALEHHGITHIAHFGTLLGAVRLDGLLPWDEDADIYCLDADMDSMKAALAATFERNGFHFIADRGFCWVRQRPWWAGQGHIALHIMPVVAANGPRPTSPDDERIALDELLPLRRVNLYGVAIFGPHDPEAVFARLYGASGSVAAMARFQAPTISPATLAFWQAARRADGTLDWPAIEARFADRLHRRGLAHVVTFPWWWFNGAYNIAIQKLRALGQRMTA